MSLTEATAPARSVCSSCGAPAYRWPVRQAGYSVDRDRAAMERRCGLHQAPGPSPGCQATIIDPLTARVGPRRRSIHALAHRCAAARRTCLHPLSRKGRTRSRRDLPSRSTTSAASHRSRARFAPAASSRGTITSPSRRRPRMLPFDRSGHEATAAAAAARCRDRTHAVAQPCRLPCTRKYECGSLVYPDAPAACHLSCWPRRLPATVGGDRSEGSRVATNLSLGGADRVPAPLWARVAPVIWSARRLCSSARFAPRGRGG